MQDHEQETPEDTLSIGKGVIYGLLLGTILWAILIGGFVWWLR